MREIIKDRVMERYDDERKITTTLGPKVANLISSKMTQFPNNITDQYAGHDVVCNWSGDFKWDYYINSNIVIETYNGHHSHTDPYWKDMADDNLIIYVKLAQNIFYVWTAKQIKDFATTLTYVSRKEFGVAGNGTKFKNFRISEMPPPRYTMAYRFSDDMDLSFKYDKFGDGKYEL